MPRHHHQHPHHGNSRSMHSPWNSGWAPTWTPSLAGPLAAVLAAALGALPGGCAKSPPSRDVPYHGTVGTGKDWSASVDHVDLTVDPRRPGIAISPLIYGVNGLRGDPARVGVGSLRAGGNRYTAFNWENNASNAGNDYMFQNDAYLVMSSAVGDAPGEAVRPMLEAAGRIGAGVVLTVPNVDYVAADKAGGGDVRTSGADYLMTRFRRNMPTKGAPFSTTPDATDDFVYQDEFVSWVTNTFPEVPALFGMDNEPDLWSKTHAAIHPAKVTYDELVMRNRDFARAVKSVWAWAPVLGFVSYGWQGFVTLENAPDNAKGEFIDYYLKQMREAEAAEGKRLIDYLDLHWYPEAQAVDGTGRAVRIVFDSGTGPAIVEARLQAPRSLWEPSYRERSWIATSLMAGIALIPRMQNKIAAHYPGTKLAFTEWNFGGGGDISGGIATADVLGIFGREGVGVANLWPVGAETYSMAAIAAYRNFDGAGAHFGDTTVAAQTSSIYSSSVYASTESNDPSRLVIVAINKRDAPTTATVKIAGDTATTVAQVFVLAGGTPAVMPAAPLTATGAGTFEYQMPPMSVSVLVPSATLPPPRTDASAGSGADGGGSAPDAENTDAGSSASVIESLPPPPIITSDGAVD